MMAMSFLWKIKQPTSRVLVLSVLFVIGGCSNSEPVALVSGTVTLDGVPLGDAQIVFENAAHGVSVNVPLAADGSYTAKTYDKAGLPPGAYQVAVRPGAFSTTEAPLVSDADRQSRPAVSKIPERYRSTATSQLAANVVAGENARQDFALTTKP
jgi:hypothetical protein